MVVLGYAPDAERYADLIVRPIYSGERVRRCTGCLALGIESPIPERSAYRFKRTEGRFVARCHRCLSEAANENSRRRYAEDPEVRERVRERDVRWRAGVRTDPERLKQRRAQQRESARRRLQDPVVRKHKAAQARAYRARKIQDPEWRERQKENQRILRRLKQERAGRPLGLPDRASPRVLHYGREKLVAWPFREWAALVVKRVSSVAETALGSHDVALMAEGYTAASMCIGERQLFRLRFENEMIDAKWIDHCCQNEGSLRIDDLYPELGWDVRPRKSRGTAREVLEWVTYAERRSEREADEDQP